jgi:hypothetical protein
MAVDQTDAIFAKGLFPPFAAIKQFRRQESRR